MGMRNITVWEFDSVDPHNISNQFFPRESIGKPKSEVMREVVKVFSPEDVDIRIKSERYKDQEIK